MQGWFKLMETIRQSGSQSNDSITSLSNNAIDDNFFNISITNGINSFERPLSPININGHILLPPEKLNATHGMDSPSHLFSSPLIASLPSTPREVIEDIPCIELEPTPTSKSRRESVILFENESTSTTIPSSPSSTDSKLSHSRLKRRTTARKSTRSRISLLPPPPPPPPPPPLPIQSKSKPIEISTPITEDISDDDVPLIDIRKHKTKSIDALSLPSQRNSIIPLATDLQSLPGHSPDEVRDVRFLSYSDVDTLSKHLDACLYVDHKSTSPTKHLYKTHYNVWNKILKLDYVKTFRKRLSLELSSNKTSNKKQQPLSVISSPTSTSFKMDWNVNRRNQSSSTHRHTPKNFFHILQLNPKLQLSVSNVSSANTDMTTNKSSAQTLERMKDILARTYYPLFYKANEYGYQFGTKSKFVGTHQLISTHDDMDVKQMPESPCFFDDSTTITLKSPPPVTKRDSAFSTQFHFITNNERRNPNSSTVTQHQTHTNKVADALSQWPIKQSVVLLTPAKISIASTSTSTTMTEKEKNIDMNRKRKSSVTTTTSAVERKKKKIVASPLVETINQIEDISDCESEAESLPSELPKQLFIKNGLRSNYYKTTTSTNSKSSSGKNLNEHRRRRRQSSGSLPPFYTGIFGSDDDKSPYIHYQLPYDIYWFAQQNSMEKSIKSPQTESTITSNFSRPKKKPDKPKQKQPLPYKKILRNVYTDQIKQALLSSYTSEKVPTCNCKPPGTCEDGSCLNRMVYTECLQNCACGSKCSNQRIRKNQWFKQLEVFNTSRYGQGLRTTASISKGTFICEYVGEIITEEKFLERMMNLYSKDEHHYTMKLTQNLVIDAYRMGSIARFANHSCSPNCEFQKWTVDGLPRMCMFALRPIKAGEELTYDYNFECFNVQSQQPCYCESTKCRGFIGMKQQATTTTNSSLARIPKITQRERRMIQRSSILLLRNLKRIKNRRLLPNKTIHRLNQQMSKQTSVSLFFPQNYYHTSSSTNSKNASKLPHKELFYLFYNHIRRSHFVKSGRYQYELIDDQCLYAQLSQLTIIMNEIFDLITNYKCIHHDITPSIVIKKCPSKRLFPTYYEIITKPIDLTMIKNKLDNGEYLSFRLFEQDLLLLFQNAATYCGEDSDEASAILELKNYFLNTVKIEYRQQLNLYNNMNEHYQHSTNVNTLENFIARLHENETLHGEVRETLYDIIYTLDDNPTDESPIVYKIVLASNSSTHRSSRSRASSDCIVHCRCGSVYDENSLVQCYACQLWQHVTCVSIVDSSRPYYCFECQPTCAHNPLACLKTNVIIAATLSPLQTYDDNYRSYSTLTRSDGFVVRINECYFVPKQDEKNIDKSLTSPEYDILFVERLWIDDYGIGQASGFYYIRPNETFHEPNRKFFPNEVFRFPSSNDPLPISSMVRPCFVLDIGTYCKGKPISDNSSRVLSSDLFICEYRVDKSARTFTRLLKSKHFGINTKSYCFDYYVEKLSIKRDYQPYQKEVSQQISSNDNRRLLTENSTKLTNKQLEEKSTHMDSIVEKIYCRYHDQNLVSNEKNQLPSNVSCQQLTLNTTPISKSNHTNLLVTESAISKSSSVSPSLRVRTNKNNKRRRTISLSSDDEIVELLSENDCQKASKKRAVKQTDVH